MPLSFAIAAEGKTDFPVLKNILIGMFKQEGVNPIVNRHHPDTEGFGNWENVFRYLREADHRDALERADFLVIQIDTDCAEHPNYGVGLRENGEELAPEQIVERVTEKLRELIGPKDLDFYGDRILFAVCHRDLECWLLHLWLPDKAEKTMGCLAALNNALRKANQPTINPENKLPKVYEYISSAFRKPKALSGQASNTSLAMFLASLAELKTKVVP